MPVARHRADRAVAACLVDLALWFMPPAPLPFELLLQCPPAALGVKVLGLGKGEALCAAKGEGSLADEQLVRRMLQDRARRPDRVSRAADPGNRAGPALAPVHPRRVHLLRAGCGEDG